MDRPYLIDTEDDTNLYESLEYFDDDGDLSCVEFGRDKKYDNGPSIKIALQAKWSGPEREALRKLASDTQKGVWERRRAGELPHRRVSSRPRTQRSCTVDGGVTIYPTVHSLRAALGQGAGGTRSPCFRYL